MDGVVAQLVSLATFGNRYLGGVGDPPELTANHSTFRFVRSVSFLRRSLLGLKETVVGRQTHEWFSTLQKEGARQLRIVYGGSTVFPLPAYIATAWAGGDRWGIHVARGGGDELWLPQWTAHAAVAHDRRSWNVQYVGKPHDTRGAGRWRPLEVATESLRTSLNDAAEFAARAATEEWAETFRSAERMLLADHPEFPGSPDLVPDRYLPLDAQRLLSAAYKGWVFGGMGSWNDLSFDKGEDGAEYHRVTLRLFEAIVDAVASAVTPREA